MSEVYYKVVGKQFGEFEDKNTKQPVPFGKLYATTIGCTKQGLEGELVDFFSINPELLRTLNLGEELQIFYNQYSDGKKKVISVLRLKQS